MGFGSAQDKDVAGELTLTGLDLGGSPVLGPSVHIEIDPRTTVLVGKNGAGKSAILERIDAAFHASWGLARHPIDPTFFGCKLLLGSQNGHIEYQCGWQASAADLPDGVDVDVALPQVDEQCHMVDQGKKSLLWGVKDGRLTRDDDAKSEIAPGQTLLSSLLYGSHSYRNEDAFASTLSGPLLEWFSSVSRVSAGVPRGGMRREEIVLKIPPRGLNRIGATSRLEILARQLRIWGENRPELFDELTELGRRTQLFDRLGIHYASQTPDSNDGRKYFFVTVDGIDIGLLSDGTARALEILTSLVDPETRLLLIDEPEGAAHPGLLARLLNEISAYSTSKQILLATQSPQVVSWASPESVRLVSRTAGNTSVRSLGEQTLARVHKYLHDEDTLGEIVYGGGLDDE